MARKMLAPSELPPLDSEMKVVYLQVAFSGTGGDLLDSCLHQAPAGKSFFPSGLLSYRKIIKKMTMSLHEERNCKSSALPLVNGDGSVLLFTLHDIQARKSSTEINQGHCLSVQMCSWLLSSRIWHKPLPALQRKFCCENEDALQILKVMVISTGKGIISKISSHEQDLHKHLTSLPVKK